MNTMPFLLAETPRGGAPGSEEHRYLVTPGVTLTDQAAEALIRAAKERCCGAKYLAVKEPVVQSRGGMRRTGEAVLMLVVVNTANLREEQRSGALAGLQQRVGQINQEIDWSAVGHRVMVPQPLFVRWAAEICSEAGIALNRADRPTAKHITQRGSSMGKQQLWWAAALLVVVGVVSLWQLQREPSVGQGGGNRQPPTQPKQGGQDAAEQCQRDFERFLAWLQRAVGPTSREDVKQELALMLDIGDGQEKDFFRSATVQKWLESWRAGEPSSADLRRLRFKCCSGESQFQDVQIGDDKDVLQLRRDLWRAAKKLQEFRKAAKEVEEKHLSSGGETDAKTGAVKRAIGEVKEESGEYAHFDGDRLRLTVQDPLLPFFTRADGLVMKIVANGRERPAWKLTKDELQAVQNKETKAKHGNLAAAVIALSEYLDAVKPVIARFIKPNGESKSP